MTRTLKPVALAAAAFCLSASAFAQSSVSAYGIVDMAAGQFQDAGAEKIYKAESGGMSTSFLGFAGSEDLGGNLKAKFAIESFLRADSGNSGRFNGDVFWARAAWVGLSGDFGTTTLGRTTNQFFVSTLIFNALGDSFGYSPSIRQVLTPSVQHPQMLAFLGDTGWSNSILYSSPSFGGLSFNLQGALGEGGAGTTGASYGGNVLYFGGPFAATLAYQQVKHGAAAFGTPAIQSVGFDSQDSVQVGVSWDFNIVKLFGQYSQVETNAATDTKSEIWGLGASVPLGAGKLLGQYGEATAKYPTTEVVNKTLTVGYDYFLSKRTDIYAVAVNDKLTNLSTGNTFAFGLKHKF
ncbi:MAG TPA: porin [Rhizobacter sp.]|jgi:predicted porin|nr:porin [Rhizobacter sp.]